jgi:predicted nuclease of predicted toxin-antitoxin system
MPKRLYRHKLLLDENLPPRSALPLLNDYFDVKHIAHDFGHASMDDLAVYQLAAAQGRTILTFNTKHFRPLVGTLEDAGVIALPTGWATSRLDSKITAVLRRHSPTHLRKAFINITIE